VLVDGVHHVTFLTEDLDRINQFYVRVFDAELTLDMTEDGVRHSFLKVGPTTVLHPFQMLGGPGPPPPSPMFTRGRLDLRQRPGYGDSDVLERAAWTTVDLD
jgi:catechol 2,3-dioxygenase-like lactoylglutathione lyase family enzyme